MSLSRLDAEQLSMTRKYRATWETPYNHNRKLHGAASGHKGRLQLLG